MPAYSLYNPSRYRAHLNSEKKALLMAELANPVFNPEKLSSRVICTDRNGAHLETRFIAKNDFVARAKEWNSLKERYGPDCYLFTHWH